MDVWVRCRVEVRRTEDGEIEQVEIKVSAHTARDTVPHTHSTAPSTRSVILARSILPDA